MKQVTARQKKTTPSSQLPKAVKAKVAKVKVAKVTKAKTPKAKVSKVKMTKAKVKAVLQPELATLVKGADDLKSVNNVAIDLRGITSFTDFFFITSGTSDRHVRSIADSMWEMPMP